MDFEMMMTTLSSPQQVRVRTETRGLLRRKECLMREEDAGGEREGARRVDAETDSLLRCRCGKDMVCFMRSMPQLEVTMKYEYGTVNGARKSMPTMAVA